VNDSAFLQHYGVKGMRWGHHKNPASADSTVASLARQQKRDEGIHTLTNDQLRKTIERLSLEKQYKQLEMDSSAKRKAAKLVADLLLGVGKQEAAKFLASTVAETVKQVKK